MARVIYNIYNHLPTRDAPQPGVGLHPQMGAPYLALAQQTKMRLAQAQVQLAQARRAGNAALEWSLDRLISQLRREFLQLTGAVQPTEHDDADAGGVGNFGPWVESKHPRGQGGRFGSGSGGATAKPKPPAQPAQAQPQQAQPAAPAKAQPKEDAGSWAQRMTQGKSRQEVAGMAQAAFGQVRAMNKLANMWPDSKDPETQANNAKYKAQAEAHNERYQELSKVLGGRRGTSTSGNSPMGSRGYASYLEDPTIPGGHPNPPSRSDLPMYGGQSKASPLSAARIERGPPRSEIQGMLREGSTPGQVKEFTNSWKRGELQQQPLGGYSVRPGITPTYGGQTRAAHPANALNRYGRTQRSQVAAGGAYAPHDEAPEVSRLAAKRTQLMSKVNSMREQSF